MASLASAIKPDDYNGQPVSRTFRSICDGFSIIAVVDVVDEDE
jgi:hypothetical protein